MIPTLTGVLLAGILAKPILIGGVQLNMRFVKLIKYQLPGWTKLDPPENSQKSNWVGVFSQNFEVKMQKELIQKCE